MVVYRIEGECGAAFFDSMQKAERFRMDTECGMGGRAQVYRWIPENFNDLENSEQYVLLYE